MRSLTALLFDELYNQWWYYAGARTEMMSPRTVHIIQDCLQSLPALAFRRPGLNLECSDFKYTGKLRQWLCAVRIDTLCYSLLFKSS